ncbi:MAG: LysM peptidoglycan-binding domain-containing protein [Chitinophagales bacterium]
MQTIRIIMKSIALSLSIFIFSLSLKAQPEQLIIKSSSKGSYVEHKVTAKENFYAIGRLFNVHPKHIASFNSLDMSKGLSIGKTIRIPLSDTNYSHKSDKGTPVYYVTGNGETVYTVSTNNSVLMEKLRKWNKISNDKLPSGSKLVVGFLVSNEVLVTAVNNTQKNETGETIKKSNPDSTKKDVAKNVVVTKPEIKKDEPKNEVINKPDTKKEETNQKDEPKKDNEVVQVKEELKNATLEQGYFKSSFEQQVRQQPITKEQTVTSGVFKTSSGWSNAKYYLLMRGAEPGTIVRITNPSNNKIIYAKLLGEMTDLKENQGLNIRISNAAASALDISETDKFIVKLNY